MLDTRNRITPQISGAEVDRVEFGFSEVLSFFRRQVAAIICGVFASLIIAGIYVATTTPLYLSTTQLIIDTRKVAPFAQQAIVSELGLDSTAIDSQVEVLKSEAVQLAVIRKLDLSTDPEFVGASKLRDILDRVVALVGLGQDIDTSKDDRTRAALRHLEANLTVERIGRTYVLEVSYRSTDKAKSAQIANAFADAYIADQVNANYEATKNASDWLEGRLSELRNQVLKADRAVQDFVVENRMIPAASGRTLAEQQVADVANQLTQARGQVAEAKARLDRISAIKDDDVANAVVTDAINNQVVVKIREQYLEAVRRVADFSSRFGSDHPAVAELKRQIEELRRGARDELRRIAEGYRSDYAIAKSREDTLMSNLEDVIRAANAEKQAGVSLRMLESYANAYRSLYDALLQKLVDSTQQQSFTRTEARVITPARPGEMSHPKILLIGSAALLLGAFGGVAFGFAREQLDGTIKTSQEVERLLGMKCLGVVPNVSSQVLRNSQAKTPRTITTVSQRTMPIDLGLERQSVQAPFSELAETMRRIKVAADMNGSNDVVLGVASALPGEGKSSIAANLAQLLRSTGSSTLLMDCDLRRPLLTKRLSPKATEGLVEVIKGDARIEDVVWQDPLTRLDFLPAVVQSPISHPATLLTSPAMESLLAEVRSSYRYVVLDLPPLAPVVDAEAMRELVDSYVLVVEWGQTELSAIREALQSAYSIQPRILGVVLNRAETAAIRRLKAHKNSRYHDYFDGHQ
jgi:succinoglycan biosynthesis transport protein ExoP